MSRFALFAVLASLSTTAVGAQAVSLDVVDGDRVLLDGQPARLVGIDSPELCQVGGDQARQAFVALLDGEISYQAVGQTGDGVKLIRLYVDGREVNQLMVQLGWAWDTAQSSSSRYAFAEQVARQEGIGLWATDSPVAPWEWKRTAANDDARSCIKYSLRPVAQPAHRPADLPGESVRGSMRLRG